MHNEIVEVENIVLPEFLFSLNLYQNKIQNIEKM